MPRHLTLKREVLVALSSDELGQVVGGSALLCISGDLCVHDSWVCVTDTCPTDVNCDQITRYCLSKLGGC